MVLNNHRDKVEFVLNPAGKALCRIDPNLLTWIAGGFAAAAGYFLWISTKAAPQNLLIASGLIFANGFFDAIDGKVARIAGKMSKYGDFLDHAIDRYADVLIIGGIAMSVGNWVAPWISTLAIIGVLLTSYMGTQAQAVGYGRNYGGVLGRAERLLLLIAGPIIQYFLTVQGKSAPFGLGNSFLEWIMIWFAVAGNLTAISRFYDIRKWFRAQKETGEKR
ncbi:MAG: CDP-alcohol phosphatidyltransferase family protein [Thermoplasmata archaeon HGW-Thermoplasmata-2]|nr:MAG: CDP-alcohol phosphatidyltransferase family protein [Thermoplasmata archaeon HGW-Thermoplasmata-2]